MEGRARAASEIDWSEIAALYALLETFRPVPAVRVNRAFAVARSAGAAAGLALLNDKRDIDANAYPYVHLLRGSLLKKLGEVAAARRSLEQAELHARNGHERAQVRSQLANLVADSEEQLAPDRFDRESALCDGSED